MLDSYYRLSKIQKIIFLVTTIPFSAIIGGISGFILGLMSITFVPTCCSDSGCHSCFEFLGLRGYEGTSALGFWIGVFLAVAVYVSFIIYFEIKKHKKI